MSGFRLWQRLWQRRACESKAMRCRARTRGNTRGEMGNKPPHLVNYLYYANHKESWEQGDVDYGAIAAEHAMRSPEKSMPCGVRDRSLGKG